MIHSQLIVPKRQRQHNEAKVSLFSINGAKTTEYPCEKNIYNIYFIHANLFQTEQTEIGNGKLQNSKITQEKIQTTLGMRQCFRNNTNLQSAKELTW